MAARQARRLQYVTGHAKDGALPMDFDWQSLADPATTTAIYMPTRTLAALVAKAVAEKLDPQTPALVIARATRPDQAVVAAPIGELPARLAQANLAGPVLVMIGHALGEQASVPVANPEDQQIAADPRRIIVVQAPPFAPQLVQARARQDKLRH